MLTKKKYTRSARRSKGGITNPLGAGLLAGLLLLAAGCQPSGPKSLLLGEKYLRQGEHERALRHLARAAELMPENAQVWNHTGLAYHGLQQPAKAAEAYQRAIRVDKKLAAARFNLGVLLLEQRHLSPAVAELTAYASMEPKQAQGWLQLGTALLRQQKYDDAERSFMQALRLDSKLPEAHNALGLIHTARKRPREAMQSFNAALAQNPSFPPALLNQAVVAQQYFDNKSAALDRYRAFLATKPDTRAALEVQGVIERLERSLNQPALAVIPAEPRPSATNAVAATNGTARPQPPVLAAQTNPIPSRTNVIAAAPEPPKAPAISNAAPAFPAANSAIENAATNAAALAANRIPPSPVTNQPAASKETPPLAKAEPPPATVPAPPAEKMEPVEVVQVSAEPDFRPPSDLAAARTEVLPSQAPTPNAGSADKPLILPRSERREAEKPSLLARANPLRWFRQDEADKTRRAAPSSANENAAAAQPAQAAPALPRTYAPAPPPRIIPRYPYRTNLPAPASGDRARSEKFFQEGASAHAQQRLVESISLYQQAIQADPAHFEPRYNLGLAAYQSKDLPLALAANEQAVALKPASADARFNFAITLREANYFSDAAQELELVVARAPGDARAHLSLANIYAEELGEPSLARRHYQRVLELEPAHPEAEGIRQWLAGNP